MAENGVSSYRCFLSGEKICLEEFIHTYSDALVRFAYSLVRSSGDAEDIAAECIAKVFLRVRRFPDETRLRAYLFKSVRNRAMDYLRVKQREIPLEDLENVLGSGDPAQEIWKQERDRVLYRRMQSLTPLYAMVLQLRYLEGLDIPQISSILGMNAKQIYNLLNRARSALKQELEKEGISYEDI